MDAIDLREQLYNDGLQGPVYEVQLPKNRITRLNGILFDLVPQLIRPGNPYLPSASDPMEFLQCIEPMLDRHPLVRRAEVRRSGSGLHAITWLNPGVELCSSGDQERWKAIVKSVQCTLLADPDAPGITALTRPVGSINCKNGIRVEVLKPGEPIDPADVEAFVAKLAEAPFQVIAEILFGSTRIQPCPICLRTGSRLDVLSHAGKCYNGCSNVRLDRLLDAIYKPMEHKAGI